MVLVAAGLENVYVVLEADMEVLEFDMLRW